MSYTSLIDGKLRQAFNSMAKDLAVPAVFSKRLAATFDFGSGTAENTLAVPITTKVIPYDGKKANKGSKRIHKQILAKAKDLGELNEYDTVEFGGHTWTLMDPIRNTGYIYILECSREG